MNLKQKIAILEACRATGKLLDAGFDLTNVGTKDLEILNDKFIAQAIFAEDYRDIYDSEILKEVSKKYPGEKGWWFLPDRMSDILFKFCGTNKPINSRTIKKLEEEIQECYYGYLARPEVAKFIAKNAEKYL
jgi:hypothetical protein